MGQLVSGGWTDAQSDALKAHVASGLSYSQAARRINEEFKTAYSRNAAIGRANRIGLAAPVREFRPKPTRTHKPKLRLVRANSNSGKLRVIQVSETEQFEPIDNEALDLAALHISLTELTGATCKWPYGTGPYTFCGCTPMVGRPYCIGHELRSRQAARHYNISEEDRERRRLRTAANMELGRRRQRRGAVA